MLFHLESDNSFNRDNIPSSHNNLRLVYAGPCYHIMTIHDMIKDIDEIKIYIQIIDSYNAVLYSNLAPEQADRLGNMVHIQPGHECVILKKLSTHQIKDYKFYYPGLQFKNLYNFTLVWSASLSSSQILDRITYCFSYKNTIECDPVLKSMASFIVMADHGFRFWIKWEYLRMWITPCSELFGLKLYDQLIAQVRELERLNTKYEKCSLIDSGRKFIHDKELYRIIYSEDQVAHPDDLILEVKDWDGQLIIQDHNDNYISLDKFGYNYIKPEMPYPVSVQRIDNNGQSIFYYMSNSGLQQDVLMTATEALTANHLDQIKSEVVSGYYFSALMKSLLYQHPDYIPALEPNLG